MVMSTEPQGADEEIQVIEPIDVGDTQAPALDPQEPVTEEVTDAPVIDDAVPAPETTTGSNSTVETAAVPQVQVPQAPAPQQNEKLQKLRDAEQERDWRERVTRPARSYEEQLQNSGYMPDPARDQARRYLAQEQKFRQQEQQSASRVGEMQGRQAAAIHFMKQHKLAPQQVLDDLIALQSANSPQDMEREAKRIQRERALIAENARLKQQRVEPQTFDNSQGSAEVTTSLDRLYDAYLRGDRSQAAIAAAKKLTLGS